MQKNWLIKYSLILTMIIFTGCYTTNEINSLSKTDSNKSSTSSNPSTGSPVASPSTGFPIVDSSDSIPKEGTVTFNISIDKKSLSSKKDLIIRIFNQEQINQNKIYNDPAAMDKRINDAYRNGQSPPPIKTVYESFTFKPNELKDILVVKSEKLKPYENYEILFSGYTFEDCNSADADVTGTVNTNNINIKVSGWRETQLGCNVTEIK